MKPRAHRVSVCWMSLKSLVRKVFSFLLLIPIYFYRVCISPLTPPSCRFTPTCSAYAVEAIKKHGPVKGLYLAVLTSEADRHSESSTGNGKLIIALPWEASSDL